jgi:thymidylate kinase
MHPEDKALLARIPESLRARNGIPEPELKRVRERAARTLSVALADVLRPEGLRSSVLGPAWSRDLDVHVTSIPDRARLAELGWTRLDTLLERLGSRGEERWALIDQGQVQAVVDFHLEAPPDPVDSVLARCRRRGEVRAREVLELRALVRDGANIPWQDPVIAIAAGVEAALGGTLLHSTGSPRRQMPPAPLSMSLAHPVRRGLRRVTTSFRPRRVVVAVSGLDGSGKSTLVSLLAEDLKKAGLPVSVVWTRPGMGIRWLGMVGRTAKRVLRQESAPGIARIGSGERPQALVSRRGLLGWTWALLIVFMFVREVRRGHRWRRGVILYDRHLLDSLVTLDVAYEGVALGVHRALIRHLVPTADLTLLLTVPPATALARKPGDLFTEDVLARQAGRYLALRSVISRLHELDGTRPARELAAQAFRIVAGLGQGR